MLIDSSAFLAILLAEPEASDFLARLQASPDKPMTTPLVRYEVVVSLARSRSRGKPVDGSDIAAAEAIYDELFQALGCVEVMLTPSIGKQAAECAGVYGKVAGHPADLNMGDCFSYAAAKAHRRRLLYKGNDFVHTDLALD
jgi:ribonuclease VapC